MIQCPFCKQVMIQVELNNHYCGDKPETVQGDQPNTTEERFQRLEHMLFILEKENNMAKFEGQGGCDCNKKPREWKDGGINWVGSKIRPERMQEEVELSGELKQPIISRELTALEYSIDRLLSSVSNLSIRLHPVSKQETSEASQNKEPRQGTGVEVADRINDSRYVLNELVSRINEMCLLLEV